MRAKSMVLILIALGCGLVASIGISQVMERNAKSGGAAVETIKIYVAASDINVNDQLNKDNVRLEDWPKSKVPEGASTKFEEVNERFALTRLYAGEPVVNRKLASSLVTTSILIPEGYRVCSLKVSLDTAVASLVKPGDRVDIIGFFRQNNDIPRTTSKKILSNVRVFAVNSETEQQQEKEGESSAAKTVSVLVKEDQVEPLLLAKQLGTLSLTLRHPKEAENSDSEGSGEASVEQLFGIKAPVADETSAGAPSHPLGGLMELLNANRSSVPVAPTAVAVDPAASPTIPGPAAPPTAVWEMQVLTPVGSSRLVWHRDEELPQLLDGSAVPVAPAVNNLPTVPEAERVTDEAPAERQTPSGD